MAYGDFTTDKRVLTLSCMAVVAGMLASGAAWLLLRLIALVTNLAYFGKISTASLPIAGHSLGWWSVLIPAAGGLIIGLMAKYGSEKIRGHGIPEAMEAILIGGSRIQPKVALLKPLSSAISIGTGGPFGAEGPIIMTGGALGSLFAQLFNLSATERKTLLVAGAAAGMTAVFGTPMAAVMLAVELLLFEWKPRSFIPVVVACVVAAACRPALMGFGPLFPFAGHMALSSMNMLFCLGIGLLAGLGSGVATALVYGFEDLFQKLPFHWMWWPVIGGLVVGLGGMIEPHALGVGFDNITALLSHSLPLSAIATLLIVKALIWSIALGSGTSGGVLAPLLIMGGALGALAGHFIPGGTDEGVWALLGMAAMMGGTMRSPLTATLFAMEFTGNLSALLPLLAACTTAHAVTVLMLKRSILTEKVARRGHHITREYSIDPFSMAHVDEVMVSEVDTLSASMPVEEALQLFTDERIPAHTSYPVINSESKVIGMASRSQVFRWATAPHADNATLGSLLGTAKLFAAYPDELVSTLADRMMEADIGRVPVIDRQNGRLVGLVARKDLLKIRARALVEERDRQAFFRPKSLYAAG
ncbi:MAG: chloride channel protein [Pseudomonadota bacterium]|nr:chloride channel protein [Pseudomonadota bacterium]